MFDNQIDADIYSANLIAESYHINLEMLNVKEEYLQNAEYATMMFESATGDEDSYFIEAQQIKDKLGELSKKAGATIKKVATAIHALIDKIIEKIKNFLQMVKNKISGIKNKSAVKNQKTQVSKASETVMKYLKSAVKFVKDFMVFAFKHPFKLNAMVLKGTAKTMLATVALKSLAKLAATGVNCSQAIVRTFVERLDFYKKKEQEAKKKKKEAKRKKKLEKNEPTNEHESVDYWIDSEFDDVYRESEDDEGVTVKIPYDKAMKYNISTIETLRELYDLTSKAAGYSGHVSDESDVSMMNKAKAAVCELIRLIIAEISNAANNIMSGIKKTLGELNNLFNHKNKDSSADKLNDSSTLD